MTHPITPPPELVQQWFHEAQRNGDPDVVCWMQATAAKAAQWCADQELKACCEWVKSKHWIEPEFADELHAARRPKSPSLKKQITEALYSENIGEALRLVEQLDD